ncbi:MAG TPA: GAF domain-containing protein [Anaeromyxobacter sp.]|nr:GAF domain-containing protein [Anaeromyxobacter sp.]
MKPTDVAGTVTVRNGLVVYASEGVAWLAGEQPDRMLGRPFSDFIVEEERAIVADRYARRRRGEPVPQRYEITLALPDGERRRVEIHVDVDGEDFHVHVRDVALRAAHRLRLEAVASLGATLQRELSEDAIFSRLRDGLGALGLSSALLRGEAVGVRVVWAAFPPALAERFLARTGAGLAGYVGRWNEFARRVCAEGSAFTEDWGVAASQFVPEALAAEARAAVGQAGLSAAVGVRVGEREDADQYLVVAGEWLAQEDAPALRLLAAQLAAALAAARTIADLSRRNEDLAALNRVAELAGAAPDLATLLAGTSEVLRGAAGCAGTALLVADERSAELVRAYADGTSPDAVVPFERIPLASPLGVVMAGPTAGVVDAAVVPDPAIQALGFRSVARIPLIVRSRTVGVLALGFQTPAAEVGARIGLLSAIGAHVAAAVESHGLLSDLRRRVGELTLLNDVALATAQHGPVDLLGAAVRRVCETVGAQVGAAYVREGDRLALVAQEGMDADCARAVSVLQVGEGAPGAAVQRRGPVEAGAADAYAGRCASGGQAAGVNAVVAVPLLAKDQAVGALVLGRGDPRGFSPGERHLLSAIGVQLGLAVDAARLFADVKRRASDLESVNALALRVFEIAPGDLRALLDAGCREIARALSCRGAAVFLSDGTGRLHGAAAYGPPLDVTKLVLDLDRDWLAREAMHRRAPAWVEDVTRDPRSAFHGRPGMPPLAMLAVPLGSRAATPGVLFVADDAGRSFSEAEIALATALAGGLGMGLENARLYADARRRVEELSLLNDMGRTVAASLDLDHVLREGADAARMLLDASRAFVLLYDPLRSELRVAGGAGFASRELDGLAASGEGGTVAARVVRERRPIVIDDALHDPSIHEAYRRKLAPRSLVAAPVLLRGEPLGVLIVDEHRADRAFTPSDVERVTAVANQLAVAIENARLYAEARRRAEELGLLHEVGRSLVETLDIQRLLDRGVRNLARIVDAPAASLLLATRDERSLEIRAVTGVHGVEVGRLLPMDGESSLAARVVHGREPIVIEDALADPRVNAELRGRTGSRGYLALPLIVRERVIGAVIIMEPRGARFFTPAEVERAAAIANQLAVAVENARLYEDLRTSYAELERAQHRLVQRERLAALGELSAVVAHEVRNPLGVIFNSLGSLRRLVRPTGDAKLLLDIVGEEADRLNRIVGDLLDFARPSTPQLQPERIDAVADEAVGAALAQKPAAIEVVRELDPGLPPVPVDARLVRQAVLNVAVNAVQAMPRGGRLTLRTRRAGEAVVVEIQDTGAGIPDEVSARIFEPFFTTKASGTGLGLAVVKRIVEGHGGAVSVRNEPGAGAVFALSFPIAAGRVEKDPALG